MVGTQYDKTSEPEGMLILTADNGSGANAVKFGGGLGEYNAATRLSFYTAGNASTRTGTERLTISDLGNVGIGATDPQRKLHVLTTANEPPVRIRRQ